MTKSYISRLCCSCTTHITEDHYILHALAGSEVLALIHLASWNGVTTTAYANPITAGSYHLPVCQISLEEETGVLGECPRLSVESWLVYPRWEWNPWPWRWKASGLNTLPTKPCIRNHNYIVHEVANNLLRNFEPSSCCSVYSELHFATSSNICCMFQTDISLK